MTKYFCDRCNNSDTSSAFLKKVSIPSSHLSSNNAKDYELCRACVQYLHDQLKPIATEAKSV